MTGSPGSGKTLPARAMPGILPEMSIEESLDVTRIYSVADQLPPGTPLIRHRPFRAPHHTISHAGLVGGGNIPKPGEISLAHKGVLFLDEFPEFGTRVLEVMRQPMEDKVVTISRAKGIADVQRELSTYSCYESLPVWILWRQSETLYVRSSGCHKISKANFRPIVGSY
jgi:predicted ATPase with chaperone activity